MSTTSNASVIPSEASRSEAEVCGVEESSVDGGMHSPEDSSTAVVSAFAETTSARNDILVGELVDGNAIRSHAQESFERIISPEGALILIDKPYGETSFHVVNRIRAAISRATGIRRIKCGHAGTLDPLATGLLVIATRKATKLLQELQGLEKTYLVRMRFGVTSPSLDLERPIELCDGADALTEEAVRNVILSLPGEHDQMPPIYSAIKQQGQPIYKKARAGEDIILSPRVIQVHDVSIVSINLPEATFRVRVSKGTYIRSLVRDLAASLGTCGILVELVRESIGQWHVANALTLPETIALFDSARSEFAPNLHHS